ncbi:anti-sigma regulatory factor [Chamaesiphon sp. VAR_48_metabat_135_sub]|uniref:ATP-binding protein n=1 Tax=Chamaesiphon sp. VAR_48_metabat_135_sub TaxID=2964699 RepID=UPI00286BFAC8|nr:anti-sigma regulatory factor [Chamaesiphon sp. VAR_48_metabat_135_sub]
MVSSPVKSEWDIVSFASTLFLCPILDNLLSTVPSKWYAEIRLGLQEALVNAAKHGNNLDPQKQVIVRFCFEEGAYWWIISDEGSGFHPPEGSCQDLSTHLPPVESESGRGMSILHQIFDRVVWNRHGTEICLCKQLYSQLDRDSLTLDTATALGEAAPKENREPLLR